MRTVLTTIVLLLIALTARAQTPTVTGRVTDAETGQAIEGATITLARGTAMLDYALTDADGRFSLPWSHTDTLTLAVHSLGYKQVERRVSGPARLTIALTPEAIALKEVEIEGGRVVMRGDTLRYDLSRYATDKDMYVKDVLRRLPGIDVQASGRVTYNGKAIDHLLVEGIDLTGGRYNQITNNLTAKAVRTAEVVQNYRAIRAMGASFGMDEVALNLRLDPDARDQWIVNAQAGIGRGDDWLWEGRLNAMQLGAKRQSLYSYRTNNVGNDLSHELMRLTSGSDAVDLPAFLSQSSISAPLLRRRLLFNTTHTLSANRIHQWGDDHSLRLQAGYTYDRTTQDRTNTTVYYAGQDSVRIDEAYHLHLVSHNAFVDASYEHNGAQRYTSDRVHVAFEATHGTQQSLAQTMHTAGLTVVNDFRLICNRAAANYEVNSRLQYTYQPASLWVDGARERYRQHDLYTDTYLNYQHRRAGLTTQLRVGVEANYGHEQATDGGAWDDERRIDASAAALYLTPGLQLERDKWRVALSAPIRTKRYFETERTYLLYSPRLSVKHSPSARWDLSAVATLTRSAGSAVDLYTPIYRKTYRTWYNAAGLMPTTLSQSYSLTADYKRPIYEFFARVALSYRNSRANTLSQATVTTDTTLYTRVHCPHHTEGWTASGTVSKGVYTWHMKFGLGLTLSRQRGRQMTNGLQQGYRTDLASIAPHLSWDPSAWLAFEYSATLNLSRTRIGGTGTLDALFDMTHQAKLTFTLIRALDLIVSADAYSNDLGDGQRKNTVMTDVALTYRRRRWRLNASLRNLLNCDAYTYTTYTTTQAHTSWLRLRPREATITATYQF